ncbi:MAG: MATE family efflux transporter [Caldilineaceae bacterium]|nr:MATE family efflux transporter [Caldilineaceae bacterium]
MCKFYRYFAGWIIIMEAVLPNGRTGLTRQIAWLAGPLVLQNLSQTLLGVVDTYFVSQLSTESLAAVGLSSVIFFAVLMLFRGTANSTVVFVGRAYGEKDYPKIGAAVWRSLNMIGWFSLALVVLPWLFRFCMTLAAPADSPVVRELGIQYLQIRAFEIPLVMFSAIVWGFLVGRGDSRTPMILAWITVLANVWLDWLFVWGRWGVPAMGVAGAAYATVIANGINALISAVILWNRRNRQDFSTGQARWSSWADLRIGFQVGLPMGIGDFIEIASFSVFFALLARLGTEMLAANQIALQYMSISFTLGIAINMATATLVAMYLGAKRIDFAQKVTYRACGLAMVGMGLIGLGYLIAPDALMRVFSQDAAVIAAGVTVLQLVALYQVFNAIGIVMAGALNGAGDTTFTMLARSLLAWGLFIPLVWVMIFPLQTGIWGAWLGALIYLLTLAAVYVFRFRAGHWKTIQLT